MTREEKDQVISKLTEDLNNHQFVYVADSSDLTSDMNNNLRRTFHKNGVRMQVAKNTLIRKAVERSDVEWGDLLDTLKGTSALLFASNPKAPAIAIKDFRKKSEKPVLKGAYIDADIYIGDDQLEALANFKSKEDLIAEVVALLQAPAVNVISGLKSGGNKIAGIVKTLSEKED